MADVAAALEQPIPILLLDADGSLSDEQVLAQELALQDTRFASAARDQQSGAALPQRNIWHLSHS
jgi:exosome complex RNA-binding protein Rrp42 (RNase PH superfamily)